ncbi:hypothetical protein HMI54_006918 [Coelomomyces lativittatus]|nr:hypothetical protein HMI54_006918 [Coelomomyces lativittatus]KAJ1512218.1 hypothetical protein HMI56_004351 [Coelomomyces lativittatus]KAJ1517998.1 hypothetical protein HMI55_004156 [Coelomomyces lativittatus]
MRNSTSLIFLSSRYTSHHFSLATFFYARQVRSLFGEDIHRFSSTLSLQRTYSRIPFTLSTSSLRQFKHHLNCPRTTTSVTSLFRKKECGPNPISLITLDFRRTYGSNTSNLTVSETKSSDLSFTSTTPPLPNTTSNTEIPLPNLTTPSTSLSTTTPTSSSSSWVNYTVFDTYKLVKYLETRGFTRPQAVYIMRTMNHLLKNSLENIRAEMIYQTDLENETYLYKAALSELATELKILRQNDHVSLKSEMQLILRDLESLNQRSRDDISTMKSDIAIELHHRKSDLREETKLMDTKIQEVNSKLTVLCSEVKTNIETVKFESTKDVIVRILIGMAIVLLILTGLNTTKSNRYSDESDNDIIGGDHPA